MGKLCQFLTKLSAHHTSIFSYLDDNLSKYNGFPPLVCALILSRSGTRLLMGKFCQFVTE